MGHARSIGRIGRTVVALAQLWRGLTQRPRPALPSPPANLSDSLTTMAPPPPQAGTRQGKVGLVLLFCDHPGLANARDLARLSRAIRSILRPGDVLTRLPDGLSLLLAPSARVEIEEVIPIALRLQQRAAALGCPVVIGFCLPGQAGGPGSGPLLEAARLAAVEALRQGPDSIRSFRGGLKVAAPVALPRPVLQEALQTGRILPYFQPQVCARSGALTGLELLARWNHPARGLLAPAAFLADLRDAGLSSALTLEILRQGLSALAGWQGAGFRVPAVSVNLDAQDLADPRLPDLLMAALDRHGLPAACLTVEVLETVLADDEPVSVRNIARLAQLGCGVDLDDFGTGHAAIAQLRRLQVRRIKIDRSYVTGLTEDADRGRVVSAILSMADRLGLETLAEGIETLAEAELLARLGVGHLQGFAIGRPMAAADMTAWLARRNPGWHGQARVHSPPRRAAAGKSA